MSEGGWRRRRVGESADGGGVERVWAVNGAVYIGEALTVGGWRGGGEGGGGVGGGGGRGGGGGLGTHWKPFTSKTLAREVRVVGSVAVRWVGAVAGRCAVRWGLWGGGGGWCGVVWGVRAVGGKGGQGGGVGGGRWGRCGRWGR